MSCWPLEGRSLQSYCVLLLAELICERQLPCMRATTIVPTLSVPSLQLAFSFRVAHGAALEGRGSRLLVEAESDEYILYMCAGRLPRARHTAAGLLCALCAPGHVLLCIIISPRFIWFFFEIE